MLCEDRFRASESDLRALKLVAKDASLPRLDRIKAHFTRGYVRKALGDRDGAARSYRSATTMYREVTAADRARVVMLPGCAPPHIFLPQPSGPIVDDAFIAARDNLASMENHTSHTNVQDARAAITQDLFERFEENLRLGHSMQRATDEAVGNLTRNTFHVAIESEPAATASQE